MRSSFRTLGFIFALTALAWTAGWFPFFFSGGPVSFQKLQYVFVPPGTSLKALAQELSRQHIISSPARFTLYARLKSADRKIKEGEYAFPEGLPPADILQALREGTYVVSKVTIPEGYTLSQIADVMAEMGLTTRKDFLTQAEDKEFLKSLGIGGKTLEGYLFPQTYFFSRTMTVKEMQSQMVQRCLDFIDMEKLSREKVGLSLRETLILASIVERETGIPEERPLVAAVFFNRLKAGMPLQSDPTVIYGVSGFNGDLTKKDLQKDTPYNTYTRQGLPPGSICNPGKESVLAVLNPAEVPYLYFVSKNNGTHIFSTTLAEHNRQVNRYQKKLTRAKTL